MVFKHSALNRLIYRGSGYFLSGMYRFAFTPPLPCISYILCNTALVVNLNIQTKTRVPFYQEYYCAGNTGIEGRILFSEMIYYCAVPDFTALAAIFGIYPVLTTSAVRYL